MRTIRVTGRGKLKLRPDMTVVTMTLTGGSPDYAETLRRSSEDTEALRDLLAGFGFDRADLKTLSFHVDTEYESYQEDGAYKQRLVGYKFYHTLKLEFPSDNARLGTLLSALARCPAQPELQLSYTVRDKEAAKNALLAAAVIDAQAKAAVLAASAGLALGALQSIDYALGEPELAVRPMNRGVMLAKSAAPEAAYDLNIQPDDVEVTDTVTLVWEIA